jgi:type VI protein secretion system component VasA
MELFLHFVDPFRQLTISLASKINFLHHSLHLLPLHEENQDIVIVERCSTLVSHLCRLMQYQPKQCQQNQWKCIQIKRGNNIFTKVNYDTSTYVSFATGTVVSNSLDAGS